jgi:hypothetical protein
VEFNSSTQPARSVGAASPKAFIAYTKLRGAELLVTSES